MTEDNSLLERYCRMWQRNWEILREQFEAKEPFDKDLLREMVMLYRRMEELIPDSHLDEIEAAVWRARQGPY